MIRLARRLPWVAALAFLLVGYRWLERDRHWAKSLFRRYSADNLSPDGLSLAFAYLRGSVGRRGGPASVERLTRPVARARLDARGVLLRIAPERRPVEPDKAGKPGKQRWLDEAEEAWVRGGGRLVLALDAPLGGLELAQSAGPAAKVFPCWPGVSRLAPPVSRGLRGPALDGAVALFTVGDQVLIARLRLGRGTVYLLACPELLANRSIERADHLALLEQLAGGGRPVYFDELAHGVQLDVGLSELLLDWGFGPSLFLLLLLGVLIAWRERVRVGPPEESAQTVRREAVDLVESLSRLYRRVLSRRDALALYHTHLQEAVALAGRLRGEALERRTAELAGGFDLPAGPRAQDIGGGRFKAELGRLNAAFRRLGGEEDDA